MNLPNYFLADPLPDVKPTPDIVEETCRTLRRSREKHLATLPTEKVVALLCEVGADWLKPEFKFRQLALEHGPAATGFSRATLEHGLDGFFKQFTPENFRALLTQEFGDAARLNGFPEAEPGAKRTMMVAPELTVHIAAGNLPNPTLMSLTLGLLLRSAQFVKCASGTSLLPRLFAHSLHEADPHVGQCFEIAEWPGDQAALNEIIFAAADCVTATGSDETLTAIRARLPVTKRFIGYGHRLSFAFLSAEVLSGAEVTQLVSRVADDVAAWDQQGCLSPHVIYIEDKGAIAADKFAAMLAGELGQRETLHPRGQISVEESAAIASRRNVYSIRAAHDPEATKLWHSENSTAWTVVFEHDPRFQPSCLNRFIYVKPVDSLAEVFIQADDVRGKVSTVALAADGTKAARLAAELARWGVTRICPPGAMQRPPLDWRHDGRPVLGDLVSWIDFES